MSSKFQAPRGTHDVLPRDHLWWRVIRTIEEQCAQYGWSRVSTPGFEDTALFERTSGEALPGSQSAHQPLAAATMRSCTCDSSDAPSSL